MYISSDSESGSPEPGSESETAVGTLELKRELFRCLKDANGNYSGSFAHAGSLSSAQIPGLWINELGTVCLPLSERDAVELRKACHQAQFGKGSETIIDTDVRNTWELNTDQFQLQSPAWQATVDLAVEEVAQALGVVGGSTAIRAEKYKLLLYDEGAFFESHTEYVVLVLILYTRLTRL